MVKAPTKHGLERKFKSWRRGKSEKSNKRSSLKQQLRGVERLLKKLPEDQVERRQDLEAKIQGMKQEIDQKQKVIQEKRHAEKAHGQRFLDRQRLTRQEKQLRKQKHSKLELQEGLLKIALDQVYVAHHPNDVKYMPLFRKGERVIDTSRQLFRRAVTRRRVLNDLSSGATRQNCSWISNDQYKLVPREWTIQDEERVFGGTISRKDGLELKKKAKEASTREDSRFSTAPEHSALLQAADEVDAELDKGDDDEVPEIGDSDSDFDDEENGVAPAKTSTLDKATDKTSTKGDSSSSDSDSDSSDEEDADPLKRDALKRNSPSAALPSTIATEKVPVVGDTDSSDDSDSSSSSDDSDEAPKASSTGKSKKQQDSDSSSSSDNSDSSDDDEEPVAPPKAKDNDDDEEEDDFLTDVKDDDENVFSMTLKQVPALEDARGDKSQGWASQRQKPGQFKKRRVRR